MHFPNTLFKNAGFKASDIALLFDVSRVTGWRWLNGMGRSNAEGAGVNIFLQPVVTKVAQRVEAAVAAGALPDENLTKLAPPKRAAKIKSILNKHRAQK